MYRLSGNIVICLISLTIFSGCGSDQGAADSTSKAKQSTKELPEKVVNPVKRKLQQKFVIEGIWPGASPDEIETDLVAKVEELVGSEVQSKSIRTRIEKGRFITTVPVPAEEPIENLKRSIRNAIDAYQAFPFAMERLEVRSFEDIPLFVLFKTRETAPPLDYKAIQKIRRVFREESLPGQNSITTNSRYLTNRFGDSSTQIAFGSNKQTNVEYIVVAPPTKLVLFQNHFIGDKAKDLQTKLKEITGALNEKLSLMVDFEIVFQEEHDLKVELEVPYSTSRTKKLEVFSKASKSIQSLTKKSSIISLDQDSSIVFWLRGVADSTKLDSEIRSSLSRDFPGCAAFVTSFKTDQSKLMVTATASDRQSIPPIMERLRKKLTAIPGTLDFRLLGSRRIPELALVPKKEVLEMLGIKMAQLVEAVRPQGRAIGGRKITKLIGPEELAKATITTTDGSVIPIREICDIELKSMPRELLRFNSKPAMTLEITCQNAESRAAIVKELKAFSEMIVKDEKGILIQCE